MYKATDHNTSYCENTGVIYDLTGNDPGTQCQHVGRDEADSLAPLKYLDFVRFGGLLEPKLPDLKAVCLRTSIVFRRFLPFFY